MVGKYLNHMVVRDEQKRIANIHFYYSNKPQRECLSDSHTLSYLWIRNECYGGGGLDDRGKNRKIRKYDIDKQRNTMENTKRTRRLENITKESLP